LFGASASEPTDLAQWLGPFRQRGGGTADNGDGWGVAYWQDGPVQMEKSPEPGHLSRRFEEIALTLRATLMLAHVRKANFPPVPGMLNTHPFAHACCGHDWVFAHNGTVPAVTRWPCASSICRPDGETDSETAFCHLLAGIAGEYAESAPPHWLELLTKLARSISDTGQFNFLLSDGRSLYAYGHDRLHYREAAEGGRRLVLIASEPLSADGWRNFSPGELRVYRDGAVVADFRAEELVATGAVRSNASTEAADKQVPDRPLP
jgi:glutamine amidotransferase